MKNTHIIIALALLCGCSKQQQPSKSQLLSRDYLYRAEHRGSDRKAAVADLTQAIRYTPNDSELYRLRARGWADIGEEGLAVADLTKAIEIDKK